MKEWIGFVLRAKRRFPFYLVAKEFNLPVEEVMKWPMSRTMEYFSFLKQWYKMRYGDPEELEDRDIDIPDIDSSKMPDPGKLPGKAGKYAKMSNVGAKYLKGSKRRGHGATGHTFQFK